MLQQTVLINSAALRKTIHRSMQRTRQSNIASLPVQASSVRLFIICAGKLCITVLDSSSSLSGLTRCLHNWHSLTPTRIVHLFSSYLYIFCCEFNQLFWARKQNRGFMTTVIAGSCTSQRFWGCVSLVVWSTSRQLFTSVIDTISLCHKVAVAKQQYYLR